VTPVGGTVGTRPEPRLPRRLAIVVRPAEGESLPSWVDRMAVRLGVGPGRIVQELGLELLQRSHRGLVVPLLYGIRVTDGDRRAVQAATGVAPAVLDQMVLAAFDGAVLDLSPPLTGFYGGGNLKTREWALFRGSRCCPACLAETGGVWQLWWKLGCAAACPKHSTVLHSLCPGCGLPIGSGGLRPPHGVLVRQLLSGEDLLRCRNNHPTPVDGERLCRFPLTELPERPVLPEVLEARAAT
jgi:hypothetical protein